jgi:predicted nucleotidyltransferase
MRNTSSANARPLLREQLLAEAEGFIRRARTLPGVARIALFGSILTEKVDPKDVDLLVTLHEGADLAQLAVWARRLQGRLQSAGHGADVFLADAQGKYLGRTCPWMECRPGIRLACDAEHCGRRLYLHDDFGVIRLPPGVTAAPPLELWPEIIRRTELPPDVERLLGRLQDAA